ncbi:MAG: hypothetical protein IPM18_07525 [Phycisphaerales bacterium]|nr:hypothetical protein [Phycisphaerales bacterium]
MIAGVVAVQLRPKAADLERAAAEAQSLRYAPYDIADGALVYIKCTGLTPSSIWDFAVREPNPTQVAPRDRYGYIAIILPYGEFLHDESVLSAIQLHFPHSPHAYEARDGRLISVVSGKPVSILTLEKPFESRVDLTHVNVYLWNAWSRLEAGAPTGDLSIDEYAADDVNWLRIRRETSESDARSTKYYPGH